MNLSRRMFLGLAGALGIGWRTWGLGTAPAPKGFSVAAIGDPHITDASSTVLLDQAVTAVNALPDIRLTVVLGDITQAGQRGQFELAKQSLDRLARGYLAVPGNHDVAGQGVRAYAEYGRAFGRRNWVREECGWVLVGLDTCERSAAAVKVHVSRMAWLREQLERLPQDRPLALFTHHPLGTGSAAYGVKNADKVLALFRNHRLRLVASGHWHGNWVESEDGILFTTTACCAATAHNHDLSLSKGFRLFHFRDDGVETEFVPVGLVGTD